MALTHPEHVHRAAVDVPTPLVWSHPRTVVGVVHAGHRLMVDAPLDVDGRPLHEFGGFLTTSRRPALPWISEHEEHVVLDTCRRRALIAVSYLGGEVPHIPGSHQTFADVPHMMRLDHRGYWSSGLSFSPEGLRAANIEVHDDGSHLVTLNLRTGERRYVTALPGAQGDESPLWSPDGQWILVSGHRGNLLVNPGQGTWLPLDLGEPLAAATWWPRMGPSTLMVLHGQPGDQRISTHNLATGERREVTRVHLDRVLEEEELPGAVWRPQMSPDGDRVLVGDTRGACAEYQRQWGAAERLAVLDPLDGSVVRLAGAFVGNSMYERSQSRWSWSAPQPLGEAVVLHLDLRERLRPVNAEAREVCPQVRSQSLWLWTPQV